MNIQQSMSGATSAIGGFVRNTRSAIAADKVRKAEADRRAAKYMAVGLVLFAALLPELALAAPWDAAGTWVLSMLNGGLTRSLAIVAVMGCGIAAMMGKLSWQWAGFIVIGITLIFGAAAIVDAISGAVSS